MAAWSMPSMATAVVSLSVSDATGQAGDTVQVTVTIAASEGEALGSFENQLVFEPQARITTTAVNPACRALIPVTLAQFRFLPTACTGNDCTGARAAILGEETGVPPGEVYECDVAIAADAEPGEYEIAVGTAAYATPAGMTIQITETTAGVISVVVDPTATPSHTHTPIPPATNTPVATNTAPPTNTRTVTPTFPPGSDDGCQMGSGDSSNALLALLLPIAGVLVLRRRSQYRV
jgi:hypothetical protein